MSDNISKFPVTTYQREKNRRGKNSTSCYVMDRWIEFDGDASHVSGTTLAFAKVKTRNGETDKTRVLLSEFCFDLDELEEITKRLRQVADSKENA